MKKKKLTIAIIIILVLLGIFAFYFFLRNDTAPVDTTLPDGSPFGSGDGVNIPPQNGSDDVSQGVNQFVDSTGTPIARLFPLSLTPVSGFIPLTIGATTTVRYTDRATGHIYDVNLLTLEKKRVSNQTLPKIYEAYYHPDGNTVLYRSLVGNTDAVKNTVLTLIPPITLTSTTSPLLDVERLYSVSTAELPSDIGEVAVSGGGQLFYNLKDSEALVSSTFNGTGVRTILNTPFTEWRIEPINNGLFIYTKASYTAPGYAYSVNTQNGNLTKILGPLKGLTTRPSYDGGRILYSHIDSKRLSVFSTTDQSSIELPFHTLPEKCVWSKITTKQVFCGVPTTTIGKNEPDNWYKGITHFSDVIWALNPDDGAGRMIVSPKQEFDVDIDVYNPQLSSSEDYMVFMNKRDLSLWALKIQ